MSKTLTPASAQALSPSSTLRMPIWRMSAAAMAGTAPPAPPAPAGRGRRGRRAAYRGCCRWGHGGGVEVAWASNHSTGFSPLAAVAGDGTDGADSRGYGRRPASWAGGRPPVRRRSQRTPPGSRRPPRAGGDSLPPPRSGVGRAATSPQSRTAQPEARHRLDDAGDAQGLRPHAGAELLALMSVGHR